MAFSISMIGKPLPLLAELQARADAMQATPGSEQDYDDLSRVMTEQSVALRSMTSPDNDLGAVFEHLTAGPGQRRATR